MTTREGARTLCIRALCVVAMAVIALQSTLPLIHEVLGHGHEDVAVACVADQGGHDDRATSRGACETPAALEGQGGEAAHDHHGTPGGPRRCATCADLVLVKLTTILLFAPAIMHVAPAAAAPMPPSISRPVGAPIACEIPRGPPSATA